MFTIKNYRRGLTYTKQIEKNNVNSKRKVKFLFRLRKICSIVLM